MKDIIELEKEMYPKIIRKAIGKIDGVSYVTTLECDGSFGFKWWVRLYKEERFVSKYSYSSRQILFYWKFFANRYFSKLINIHSFKEEQKEV